MGTYPKTATEVQAAERLGVLDEFVLATSLPDEARQAAIDGDPKTHILVIDGRKIHGDNIIVWLAERMLVPKGRYKVLGRAHTLPRYSASRPALYVEADKVGIVKHILRHHGYQNYGKLATISAPKGSGADLTDATLSLIGGAKSGAIEANQDT